MLQRTGPEKSANFVRAPGWQISGCSAFQGEKSETKFQAAYCHRQAWMDSSSGDGSGTNQLLSKGKHYETKV
jgi:hypothetical protein